MTDQATAAALRASGGVDSKRGRLVNSLLGLAGVIVASESAKIVFVGLGWRTREQSFELEVTFCASLACCLGAYVAWQATTRTEMFVQARERRLAKLHEKAKLARAARANREHRLRESHP